MKQMAATLLVCLALLGCGDGSSVYLGRSSDAFDRVSSQGREPFDEDAAREAAENELVLQGYDFSYGCTADCSGHEAGWNWRAEYGYSTYGNSQSFAEGGWAFDEALERRVEEMRDSYEAGFDPEY